MTKIIEINNLQWRYPSVGQKENPWVIKGINLDVHKGEVIGITGPSGVGKTTLCRLIMGILPHGTKIPFQRIIDHIRGEIKVLGETVSRIDEEANVVAGIPLGKLEGKGVLSPRIGMVMQDPENQFLQMSLLHELGYGLSLKGIKRAEILERSQIALESVGLGYLWEDAENIHPLDLSGGQKQRVAIAAFLALSPDILLLDEPTSDLDPYGKYEVIQTVRKIKKERDMTIILVELDPELLYEFCDRVILLQDGKIVTSSDPKYFFTQLDVLERHGVAPFEVSRIAKHLSLKEGAQIPVTIEECIRHVKPQNISPPPERKLNHQTEIVVEVENLFYEYSDGTRALSGANLTVKRGEMLALLGTNGGGKTTLAKVISGLYSPTSGKVRVFGKDMVSKKSRREIPQYVGYVFQNPDHQIFTRKVYDEINYGLENLGVSKQTSKEIVERTLQMVGLSERQEEDPMFLGKGQRQRLAVAAVLSLEPDLIIVDEPTTGQDFRMVHSIMQLLAELHQQNKTIIIITHDMTIVADYCDRAIVLAAGTTVFDGTPQSLFDSPTILKNTHLRTPQAFQLGQALRKENKNFPVLLNVREWIDAIGPDNRGANIP